MKMKVTWVNGHSSAHEITSWQLKDNCLVITFPKGNGEDGEANPDVTYIPIYNVLEFTPENGIPNRYIQ